MDLDSSFFNSTCYNPVLSLFILLLKQGIPNLGSGTSFRLAPLSYVGSYTFIIFWKHFLTFSQNKMFQVHLVNFPPHSWNQLGTVI